MTINLIDVEKAKEKMKGIVHVTPLDYSSTFSELSNNDVFLKLENLQKTGSFKVRGSCNKLFSLTGEELQRGVIAASAGNHAQGVAYSSKMLKIACTIVMPKGAPLSKVEATKRYGAEVVLKGNSFDEALHFAIEMQQKTGATFVHPFDDHAVIAGQGTIGLELMEQLPTMDAVICPVGGGGLIAGIALVVKTLNPAIKVYGVQALSCPSMKQSLQAMTPIEVEAEPTMADGIAVRKPGLQNFEIIRNYVDDIFCVDEMEISRTMLMVLERNKLLVEGSGASALAALLYKKVPIQGKKVVSILSGGNVDVNFISRIIEHGMVEAGRFVHFSTILKDKPGHLQEVLQFISELEGNVLSISLEHVGEYILPGYAKLILSLETKNKIHREKILSQLKERGYDINLL
ncbi:threonine ammonia-lyase [Anaerobacillus isosaccharinicus]|uniref:threonine ammonia-lyase n=1 Tax=Anaerobacillus isosaccharinicus TaxID=1532552 RepID=A0A1S2LKL3_9BACI|nr:threonine ammonia-lyase [Anaerobacillus isosaccharinicus]MBA5586089.1 threonine ammonia-lyase [Anaerobacillus isosaccharinicus]QOY35641.1 threonine ammonia-lyase [Anaerobacillus isosaccharinicus]